MHSVHACGVVWSAVHLHIGLWGSPKSHVLLEFQGLHSKYSSDAVQQVQPVHHSYCDKLSVNTTIMTLSSCTPGCLTV